MSGAGRRRACACAIERQRWQQPVPPQGPFCRPQGDAGIAPDAYPSLRGRGHRSGDAARGRRGRQLAQPILGRGTLLRRKWLLTVTRECDVGRSCGDGTPCSRSTVGRPGPDSGRLGPSPRIPPRAGPPLLPAGAAERCPSRQETVTLPPIKRAGRLLAGDGHREEVHAGDDPIIAGGPDEAAGSRDYISDRGI